MLIALLGGCGYQATPRCSDSSWGTTLEVWRGDDMLADVRPGTDGWTVTFFAHGQLVLSLDELDEIQRRAAEFVGEQTGRWP